MRKLMWFALGFALICGVFAWSSQYWLVALIVSTLTAAISALLSPRMRVLRRLAVLSLGMVVAVCWCLSFSYFKLNPALRVDGKQMEISAVATDYGVKMEYSTAVEAKLTVEGRKYLAILYIYEDVKIEPGDRVSGVFSFRCTTNDEPMYQRGNGIFLLGYGKSDISVQKGNGGSVWLLPARLRQQLLERIDDSFPGDAAVFAKALLLGERSEIPYDMDISFQRSGISHIIAVSGLHVSMLLGIFFLLFGRGSSLFAVPLLILFAAVAGGTPSITRACLMECTLVLSTVLKREYDPPTSLSAAALVMLMVNPFVITSVGFQLSVGSVTGIFLFAMPLYRRMSGLPVWAEYPAKSLAGILRTTVCSGVSVTLGALSLTTPLIAYYFGAVSLASVLTNLLVLPVVTVIFCLVGVTALLSLISTSLAAGLGWCAAWLIRSVLWIVDAISRLPLAAIYVNSPFVLAWLIFAYILFALFLIDRKRKLRILFCCCTMSLCVCLPLSWFVPSRKGTALTMLDVGQGQCVLLSDGDRHFLVDCGGDYDDGAADAALQELHSRGVFHLAGVIVTHYDRDHAGGVDKLLSVMHADYVFLPDIPDERGIRRRIEDVAGERIVWVNSDRTLCWDNSRLEIFAPVLSISDNESGISVLFSGENCDILITGDLSALGEAILLSEKSIPKLDVLVVGHHGSNHSTGEKLLNATKPEYALISVGAENSYGHPGQQVLARLEQFGCKIYRTDLHGAVTFRR